MWVTFYTMVTIVYYLQYEINVFNIKLYRWSWNALRMYWQALHKSNIGGQNPGESITFASTPVFTIQNHLFSHVFRLNPTPTYENVSYSVQYIGAFPVAARAGQLPGGDFPRRCIKINNLQYIYIYIYICIYIV